MQIKEKRENKKERKTKSATPFSMEFARVREADYGPKLEVDRARAVQLL